MMYVPVAQWGRVCALPLDKAPPTAPRRT
jgi:hypothetical protein